MSGRWFYTRDGTPNGPFSAEEMKSLAGRRVLSPSDWIWQEGQDRQDGALAENEFDFSLPPATPGLPDWLDDVAKIEPEPPVQLIAEPLPAADTREWLADLRLWIELELPAPAAKPPDESATVTPTLELNVALVVPVPTDPRAERMRAESGCRIRVDPGSGQVPQMAAEASSGPKRGARRRQQCRAHRRVSQGPHGHRRLAR